MRKFLLKNFFTPPPPTPTLLACFIIRASLETVKVLVTHGRTQKKHGENIITEILTAVPNTLTQQRRCYHATGHLQQTDNRPIWRHRHTWTSPQNMLTPLPCNTRSTTVTQPWYHDQLKWTTWNTYVQNVSKTSQQRTNIISTGRTITLYTVRWKCYLCGMDFFKRFERSVHSATEHPDAPILTPHNSLGDLWHPPVNLPRATKHAPMSQVASKNEHTAPSSLPLSPEVTPWQAK